MAEILKAVEGRSFHSDNNSKYLLPNDSPEHARLELQHKYFVSILENRPFRAPVSKPSQILDIGCGTGCMTTWLAGSFPAATVTGLDLSPVPKLRDQPVNVRYLKGNVLQQGPRDWISEDGDRPVLEERESFDFVFSRLLVAGIRDWEGCIAKQFSLVKPGGWVEGQEPAMVVYDSEDRIVDVWEVFTKDPGMGRMDDMCGQKMKGWMLGAGFEKVETEVIKIPFGSKGQQTDQSREIGEWFMKNTFEVAEIAARRGGLGRQQEELETMIQEARAALSKADGWYMKFYVSYGRKPEYMDPKLSG